VTEASPIEVAVKRHKYPGCKRSFSSRSYARKHVQKCQRIEANHGCLTCALFCKGCKPDPRDPYDRGEPDACSAGISLEAGLNVRCAEWEVIY
jgi:hypothetical protein